MSVIVHMNVSLTVQEILKDLRVKRGLTLEQLSEQTKISKSALGNYETEDYKDISHYSIVTLAKFYDVSTDYILGLVDDKNHPNTELSELHLSDKMIELLKSGKLNNRLLCEMAAHKDFVKLLADIEIYVDAIAGMQIQNLNAWVDVVREEIITKYRPSEDDPNIRVMDAAHIQETEYFRHIVHDDMDSIIQDIREVHKNDSTSAPDTTPVAELKKGLETAASYKGSPQEKLVVIFCEQLDIDYKKLTAEEFQVIKRVLQKSKVLKSQMKQRGKKWK